MTSSRTEQPVAAPDVDALEEIRARLRRLDALRPDLPAVMEDDDRLARAATALRAVTAKGVAIARATAPLLSEKRIETTPALNAIGTTILHALRWSLSRSFDLGARAWTVTTEFAESVRWSVEDRVDEYRRRPRLSEGPAETARVEVAADPIAPVLVQAEQRLAATERRLGYDHPSVAAELQFIGALHHERAHYTEALAFYGAALGIQQRTLGSRHPSAAATAADAAAVREEELAAQSLSARRESPV